MSVSQLSAVNCFPAQKLMSGLSSEINSPPTDSYCSNTILTPSEIPEIYHLRKASMESLCGTEGFKCSKLSTAIMQQ